MGEDPPPPAPAPTLGEANREIYQHRLGISDRELAMLGSGAGDLIVKIDIKTLPLRGRQDR